MKTHKIITIIISFILITLFVRLSVQGHENREKKYDISPTPIKHVSCITPSFTPTPTATPEASLTPTETPTPATSQPNASGGVSTEASNQVGTCGDTKPGDVPNFIVKDAPTGLELNWALIPGADYIDIRFGYANSGIWSFGAIGNANGEISIPNNGHYTVEGLTPNTAYDFEIAGGHGCALGNWSIKVDPKHVVLY